MINYFMLYNFIKMLSTPFSKWEAYKYEVINDKGEILVPKRERNSTQNKYFGAYENMVRNLKIALQKIPGAATKLGSFTAALYLLKEHNMFLEGEMTTLNESKYEIDFDKVGEYVSENVAAAIISDGWMSKSAQKRWTQKNAKDFLNGF